MPLDKQEPREGEWIIFSGIAHLLATTSIAVLGGDKMKKAVRTVAASFGFLAGFGGPEHGIFEIMQGHVKPDGLMIASTFFMTASPMSLEDFGAHAQGRHCSQNLLTMG